MVSSSARSAPQYIKSRRKSQAGIILLAANCASGRELSAQLFSGLFQRQKELAMRHNHVRTALTACAALFAASAAFAADDAKVRKEMMAMFDKTVKQFKTKDLKGFMSMFADD